MTRSSLPTSKADRMRWATETSGASPLARAGCTDTSTNWIGSRDDRIRSRISASAKADCGANGRSEDDNTRTCLVSPLATADNGQWSSNSTSNAGGQLPRRTPRTRRCCHIRELPPSRCLAIGGLDGAVAARHFHQRGVELDERVLHRRVVAVALIAVGGLRQRPYRPRTRAEVEEAPSARQTSVFQVHFHGAQARLEAAEAIDRSFRRRTSNLEDEHRAIRPGAALEEGAIGRRIHIDVGERLRLSGRRSVRAVGHAQPRAEEDPFTEVARQRQPAAVAEIRHVGRALLRANVPGHNQRHDEYGKGTAEEWSDHG